MAAHLHLTSSVEEQWGGVVEPWLDFHGAEAWRDAAPTVVLTPSRAEGFYLRSRLVAQKRALLGVYFWTPSDARKFLSARLPVTLRELKQADLRLLSRLCASSLGQGQDASTSATLAGVVQEPGPFLRAYDLLLGAGWSFTDEGVSYGRQLGGILARELRQANVTTQAGLHRHLREVASTDRPPLLSGVLIAGFNAAHWPLWDLLQAVVGCARHSTLALQAPRVFAGEVDQLWISSWEEVTAQSYQVPEMPDGPVSEPLGMVAASYESGQMIEASSLDLRFLVTAEVEDQVRAIALQIFDYLRRDDCTRLGILFPEADSVALGVAHYLRERGIPFNDGTGFIQPGLFEKRFWKTWLAVQEEPSVRTFIAWIRACEAAQVSFGTDRLPAADLAMVLDKALGQSLVDDLDFLARQLDEEPRSVRAGEVADFLRNRASLPATASCADFLAATRRALQGLGWIEHLAHLPADPPKNLGSRADSVPRKTFLQWLREITDSRERSRGRESNHFYGKVHLLIYAQASGQAWSHLILTGLNEGMWPRLIEAGAFGSRHEWTELNRKARTLNRRGATEGSQGSGHETVRKDHGYCLLPLERYALGMRDLCSALESTTRGACLTALTAIAGKSALPSDLFAYAYQAKTSQILDDDAFTLLAKTTAGWVCEHSSFFQTSEKNSSFAIASTREAHAARRDETRPFGPFEFAYATPPVRPIQLTCKTWELAWNHPSSIWLEKIVGVSRWPEGTLNWPSATGTWVHRWMTGALRDFAKRRSTAGLLPLLQEAAQKERDQVEAHARIAGIPLYPWWPQIWGHARSLALGLAETLEPELADKIFASEATLPDDLAVALPGSVQKDFILKGRIDLLLVEGKPTDLARLQLAGCSAWVIDFKTGGAQNLNSKAVRKGRGVQTLLYALAAEAGGARPVSISLHTFDIPLQRQIGLDEALACREFFHSLEIFHRDGIFGMRGDTDGEHGFSPVHPMATRPVPASILKTKWALVHGWDSLNEEETG